MEALALGFQPVMLADAVGSRRVEDMKVALDRLGRLGITITTTEAAILELTGSSDHLSFEPCQN